MTHVLLAGFLSGLSLIVAIGAQNAFVLQQALRRAHRLPLFVLCSTADAILIAAGIAGLGALIQASPKLLAMTRYGGAAFLLAYAILAARRVASGGQLRVDPDSDLSRRAVIVTGLGLTFLNPHVYLDTVILLGSLANQHGDGRWWFGGGAMLASLVWFSALAFGASLLAPWFRKPAAWRVLDTLVATVMGTLGIGLLT